MDLQLSDSELAEVQKLAAELGLSVEELVSQAVSQSINARYVLPKKQCVILAFHRPISSNAKTTEKEGA